MVSESEKTQHDFVTAHELELALAKRGWEISKAEDRENGGMDYEAERSGVSIVWSSRVPLVATVDGGWCIGSAFVITREIAVGLTTVLDVLGDANG